MKKDKSAAKDRLKHIRHCIVSAVLWLPVYCFLRIRFRFRPQLLPKIKGPMIVMINHSSDNDPFFAYCISSFRHMYFVASEHLFRKGFGSKIMIWLLGPIARMKGSTDGAAAVSILRATKAGRNICIFPEGACTYNGVTIPAHPTVGRLARMSGATLVTYRITGGYMQHPRWSLTHRSGPAVGKLVGIYPPETLKAMTNEQVSEVIAKDLYVNAYEMQRTEPVRYGGSRRAETLETCLYICPKCGGVSTLHSSANRFFCDCGLDLTVDEYGFFRGDEVPFDAPDKWDEWQTQEMTHRFTTGEKIVFCDENAQLLKIGHNHTEEVVAAGLLVMSREIISVGDYAFSVSEISTLTLRKRNIIMFSVGDDRYEIRNIPTVNARKHQMLYDLLK